jgi:2-polyprenyl-3-methyl-5-hydroxy-6-metoxy-1,4-benzoquinol methylase
MKRISEDQEEFFFDNENVNKYLDEVKNASMARYSGFLSALKNLDIKGRYLDVGCGPGVLTKHVARLHPEAEVVGNDIVPEMIKLAQDDLDDDLKARISYKIGDACDINTIKDYGKFDLVFSTFTMHHWANAEKAIQNLYSLLNENGVLYIYDLKRVWWLYYLSSKGGFFSSIRASYRPKEIKTIMTELGINNYKTNTVPPFFLQSILIRK